MTTKATHTPTPWILKEYGTADDFGNFQEFIFIEANDEHIASIYDVQKNRKTATESDYYISPKNASNAAHIVACVNRHDALVKALRDLLFSVRTPDALNEVSALQAENLLAAIDADKPDNA